MGASIAALLAITGWFTPSAVLSEVAEFTGSENRTLKFRYKLKAGWSSHESCGVLIHFHGNVKGTQEDVLSSISSRSLAWRFDLIPVTIASPKARLPGELYLRIVFRFEDGEPVDVDLVDYH